MHFERRFASWRQIGFRSLTAALSDLAAMSAAPRAALVALIVPEPFDDAWLFELADGVAEAARLYDSPVVGGNLSAGAELSITSTVLGVSHGAVLTRGGARPGDCIYLTGPTGEAALGLQCLKVGLIEAKTERFIERWRRPAARIVEGVRLLGVADAAIDVSDGVLQDLSHLCDSSRTGAELDADAVPVSENAKRCAQQLGFDALELALTGGEDYELIFTANPQITPPPPAIPIGRVTDRPGVIEVRDRQRRPLQFASAGHRHWR